MKQRFLPFHPRIIKDYCGHDIAKLRDERANFSLERDFNLEGEIVQDFSNGHRKVLLMTSLASIFKILDKLENVESRNSFPLFRRDKFFQEFSF